MLKIGVFAALRQILVEKAFHSSVSEFFLYVDQLHVVHMKETKEMLALR
jgi:hypothetical protein